ncbi:MAG: apolipoprotein N-acyltransferase [Rhodobacteraceae bacterium]|nr:apolipoprotein N-acyltransferase [Paracoccaceae bacterium]
MTGWRRFGAAAFAGVLLALAQAPLSWAFTPFLALPLLLWLLEGAGRARVGFLIGWAAGVGYFAASMFWIVEPFFVEPEVYGWMAPFALIGMAGGLSLFWGAAFAASARPWAGPGARLILLAGCWTLAEYARAHVLTGFPWGLVAYGWSATPVFEVLSLLGPHGLGFATLLAAMVSALLRPRLALLAILAVAAGWGYGLWRLSDPAVPRTDHLVVRVVQPNAKQEMKWDPVREQVFFDRLLSETMVPATPRPDIVVWPETAVPFLLGENPALQREIAAAAGPDTTLILGIRRRAPTPDGDAWFNSLVVLDPATGAAEAVYDKHHLVPFGEYIPLSRQIARLGVPALAGLTGTGFSEGPGPRLVRADGLPPFLPLICYEAIFPSALQPPGGRPDWLVQITNDAWFGTVSGPYQHFVQARARAIEQGLPLVRAANTGISAVVDPMGRVLARIALGQQGHVDHWLPAPHSPTVYAILGDVPLMLVVVLICLLTVLRVYGGISGRVGQ